MYELLRQIGSIRFVDTNGNAWSISGLPFAHGKEAMVHKVVRHPELLAKQATDSYSSRLEYEYIMLDHLNSEDIRIVPEVKGFGKDSKGRRWLLMENLAHSGYVNLQAFQWKSPDDWNTFISGYQAAVQQCQKLGLDHGDLLLQHVYFNPQQSTRPLVFIDWTRSSLVDSKVREQWGEQPSMLHPQFLSEKYAYYTACIAYQLITGNPLYTTIGNDIETISQRNLDNSKMFTSRTFPWLDDRDKQAYSDWFNQHVPTDGFIKCDVNSSFQLLNLLKGSGER